MLFQLTLEQGEGHVAEINKRDAGGEQNSEDTLSRVPLRKCP